jgi:SNF2 family DNA or RNA helicase
MTPDYSKLDEYIGRIKEIAKDFQHKAIAHMHTHKRSILRQRGGTGKTLEGLTACFLQRPKKVLVLCSKNALWTWEKETKKWFPELMPKGGYKVVHKLNKAARAQVWKSDGFMYVCTFAILRMDIEEISKHDWDVILIDEWHRGGFKNRKTQAVDALWQLRKTPCIFPMSGSGTSKGPQNLFALLNILDPSLFSSYWKYLHTYCVVEDDGYGKKPVGPKNMEAFARVTHNYFYDVPDSEVLSQLPARRRLMVPIECTPLQDKHYAKLDEDMYDFLEDGSMLVVGTVIAKYVKLRQLLACPKILGINDWGAGIEAAYDKIQDLEVDRSVIFTPFRDGVPLFKEYLIANGWERPIYILWGGTEPEEIKRVESEFRAKGGIVLCTTLFSQSFELETANNCHFIGYEWNQEDNDQCEWRLQRMTSDKDKEVTAYYYQHRNTIDDEILAVLDTNTRNVATMYKSIHQFKAMLRRANGQEKI